MQKDFKHFGQFRVGGYCYIAVCFNKHDKFGLLCFEGGMLYETRPQFIERKRLNFNRENIEVYVLNLDVFSIGNQCFAFNELSRGF